MTDWMSAWDAFAENTRLEVIEVSGVFVKPGDQVRLRPRGGADAFDLLLAGHIATIESIEQDFENRIYLAVTVDEDPGKEWGALKQPGHRFFFSPDEVEPVP